MELYKFLQQQGVGSRNECKQRILRGLVAINGQTIREVAWPLDEAAPGQIVMNGEPWEPVELPVYLALHKPRGFESSHQPAHHPSVFSLLPRRLVQMGLEAVGRLDADTSGLLLFTSNGQFVHALTSPRRHVAKRYRVQLKHPASPELLERLTSGVVLKDDEQMVRADAIAQRDTHIIDLTISEGRYHQVKRMVGAAGNRVAELHREAIGAMELGELAPGDWRLLTREELQSLGF